MRRPRFAVLATLSLLVLSFGLALAPTAGAVTFAPFGAFTVGANPASLAVGDFNGDGRQDVVASNAGVTTVTLLLNNGAGGFAAGVDLTVGPLAYSHPYGVAAADLNGDAAMDIVAAIPDTDTVSVLLNDGSGGFRSPVEYLVGDTPNSVTPGDVNGDGARDLVTTNTVANTVTVLLNDGAGAFGSRNDYVTGSGPWAVVVRDLDGDGKADLATTDYYDGTISVLLNDGNGGFGARTWYATGNYMSSLTTGDFNGDKKADLAASAQEGIVSVLLNIGGGTFGAKTDYTIGSGTWPYAIAVGDFNGDRRQDLVTVNMEADSVSLLLGDGKGGFGAKTDYATGDGPDAVAVADFDRDGRHDVVTANNSAGAVGLLRNTTVQRIYALSPTKGKVGATVTITGWGFGRTRGTSKVYFGTKAVTKYVYWSAGKIKVKVPSLTKGRKAVTVRTSLGKSGAKYFTVL